MLVCMTVPSIALVFIASFVTSQLTAAGCGSDPEPSADGGGGGGTANSAGTGNDSGDGDATADGAPSSNGTIDGGSDDTAGGGTTSSDDVGSDTMAGSDGPDGSGGSDSSGGSDGSDGSGGSTGGVLPFDCDDGEAPVRVEGGGSYDTISEGVEAAPPDGVVVVCPGQYTDNVTIERSVTIRGAGSQHVTVNAGTGSGFLSLAAEATAVRLEGMTVQNGTYGVRVNWPSPNGDPSLELEDMRITDVEGIGVWVEATGYYGSVDLLDTTIDNVEGGTSPNGLFVGGALYFRRISATMTDCVLEDNVASSGGGMSLTGVNMTFIGGRVVRNTATQGGGAVLTTSGFPGVAVASVLTIEDSDWGAGAGDENQDTDVWCDTASDAAGFLGVGANAVCSSDVSPCCL